MNLSSVINQLISLFLMMLTGYVVARVGIITPDFRKRLSALTLNTAGPCIILSSVLESSITGGDLLQALGMAVFFYVLMILLALVLVRVLRVPKEQRNLDQLMLIFTNVGFMGIPVVQSIYGTDGVALVAVFILTFNLLFFSYGVLLISGGMRLNLRALCNACIFAALLGLFFGVTGLHLPETIESTLASIGAMNTPLAMIVIGASIAHSDVRVALTNPRLYRVNVLRMLVMPLLVLAVMRFMPGNAMLRGISVIMAAMPIAGNCAMQSDIYTPDDMTASHAVMLSTLISGVSLPVICAVMAAVL